MNKRDIQQVLIEKKLMKDWLDNPEVKFMGLFPFIVASIAFTWGLFITPTPATASLANIKNE